MRQTRPEKGVDYEEQTEEAFRINRGSLPPGANPKEDLVVGETDAGGLTYRTVDGTTYTIYPDMDQRPKAERMREGIAKAGKAVVDYAKDPSLPSGEQVKGAVEAIDRDMERILYSEDRSLLDVGSMAGGSGVAGQFGRAPAGALRSFSGRTYEPKGGSERPGFRNPVEDALANIKIPNKGIKGSELIKSLESDPEIRGSLLSATGLKDLVDPQKRYDKAEIDKLNEYAGYQAGIGKAGDQFIQYQRQDSVGLQDPELDYQVLTIEAAPSGTSKATPFKAKGTHFDESTIAHTRVSRRTADGEDEDYLLVEELQSDLLQKGYDKPRAKADYKALSGNFSSENYNSLLEMVPEDTLNEMVELSKVTGNDPEGVQRFLDFYDNNEKAFSPYMEQWGDRYDLSTEVGARSLGQNLLRFSNMLARHPDIKTVGAPPIKKTKEGVDATLKGIFSYAQGQGLDKIRIPPFEKIVEARFPEGTDEYLEMIEEGSPFHRTYVTALNQSLKQLQDNYPVTVSKVPMKYDNTEFPGSIPVAKVLRELSMDEAAEIGNLPEGIGEDFIKFWVDAVEGVPEIAERIFPELVERGYFPSMGKKSLEGIEIDLSKMQDYDLTRPRFAEGGVVMDMERQMELFSEEELPKDPVSGNEVPPGSSAKEVRDDAETVAEEGSYVVPADVVQYYGREHFEKMRNKALESMGVQDEKGGEPVPIRISQGEIILEPAVVEVVGMKKLETMRGKAKEDLARMEEEGRMGGEPEVEEEVDEELSDEELAMLMEVMGGAPKQKGYAEGGPVEPGYTVPDDLPGASFGDAPGGGMFEQRIFVNDAGQKRAIIFVNGEPIQRIPKGFRPMQEVQEEDKDKGQAEEVKTGEEDVVPQGEDKWDRERNEAQNTANAIDVTEWGLEDFQQNLDFQGSKGEKGIRGMAAMMGPFAGPMALGQKLTNRAAATQLEALVAAGQTEYKDMLDQYTKAGIEPFSDKSLVKDLLGVEFGPKGLDLNLRSTLTPNQKPENVVDTTPDMNVYDALRDGINRDETISGSTSTQGEFADVTESMTDMARQVAADQGDGRAGSPSEQLDAAERDAFDGVSSSDFMNKGGLVRRKKRKPNERKKPYRNKKKGLASKK